MKENNNAPASREPSISNNPSEQKKTPKISRRVLLAGSVGVGVAAASGLYVAGSNWRASLNGLFRVECGWRHLGLLR